MASERRVERGWYHVHVRLTREDYDYLRRLSAESAEPVSTIMRGLIRTARLRGRAAAAASSAHDAEWGRLDRPARPVK